MRIKEAFLLAVIILVFTTLVGCVSSEELGDRRTDVAEAREILTTIETRYSNNVNMDTHLVYHKDTKIIYMLLGGRYSNGITPFISENGNYMRYIDGKFMEIAGDGELVIYKDQFK